LFSLCFGGFAILCGGTLRKSHGFIHLPAAVKLSQSEMSPLFSFQFLARRVTLLHIFAPDHDRCRQKIAETYRFFRFTAARSTSYNDRGGENR